MFFVFFTTYAYAEEGDLTQTIKDILDGVDLSGTDGAFGFENLSYDELLKFAEGGGITFDDLKSVFNKALRNLSGDIVLKTASLLVFVVAGILIEIIKPESKNSSIATAVVTLGAAGVGAACFISSATEVKTCVSVTANGISLVFPIMLSLMAAGGGKVSVGVFKPAVATLLTGLSVLTERVLLPLCYSMAIVGICSSFSKNVRLKRTCDFLKSLFKWTVGIAGTAFSLFVTAQGITASCYDGFSLKAVKYALSASAPGAGQFLGGGFDVVCAASLLIKNAFGILAAIGVILACVSPLLKSILSGLAMRFVAAVGENSENLSGMFAVLADCFSCLTTVAAATAVCELVTIFLAILAVGNI